MKTKNKPKIHPSMKSLADETNIPIDVIRWAKKQGAPGFRGARVHATPLLAWLETHQPAPDDPTIGKGRAVLARILEQVRDLRRKNDEHEGKLIARAWVQERMGAACSQWTRRRQTEKDNRCLAAAGEHGGSVALARTMHDWATADGGEVLRSLAEVFNE